MSVINDALKRAQQAHEQRPLRRAPGPELLPVERRKSARRTGALVARIITIVIVGLVLFVGWILIQNKSQAPIRLASSESAVAKTHSPSEAKPAESPPRAAQIEAPPASQKARPGSPSVAPPNPVSPSLAALMDSGRTPAPRGFRPEALPPAASKAEIVSDNSQRTENAPAVNNSGLKLQGIFFNPARPMAMIDGKAVLIGDKLGKLRVIAIDQESATLAEGGQTYVLRLPQPQ